MPLPFDFAALPPEVNTGRMLTGPGAGPTMATAGAYSALAAQLTSAAANTENMLANMGGSYQSPSADKAAASFMKHAMWLHEQAAVATGAAALVQAAAMAFSAAHGAMGVISAEVVENHAEKLAIIGTGSALAAAGPVGAVAAAAFTGPALAANELRYLELWGEAAGVMGAYGGAVVPMLAALPKPMTAPPIVGGAGGDPGLPGNYTLSPTGPVPPGSNSGHSNIVDSGSNSHNVGDSTSDPANQHTGGGDESTGGTKDPTAPDSPQGTDPSGTDSNLPDPTGPQDALSSAPDMGESGGYGGGDSMAGQDGFYGTSSASPTLAGLTGGIGSGVAFSMMRGGMGSMPGTSTGFRMPGNWNPGATRAFGATQSQPPTSAVPPRKGPPRGASAPKAQMRRRKDDERKSKSAVFVPGEPVDVPVLERPPVIGVIEYAGDHRDDMVLEPQLAVGVIERVEDDAPIPATSERPR